MYVVNFETLRLLQARHMNLRNYRGNFARRVGKSHLFT